jgi:hypothetical protein
MRLGVARETAAVWLEDFPSAEVSLLTSPKVYATFRHNQAAQRRDAFKTRRTQQTNSTCQKL